MYKLGIDVGGINTDAVLIDDQLQVVASIKTHTPANVYEGIEKAIRTVLKQADIDRSEIRQGIWRKPSHATDQSICCADACGSKGVLQETATGRILQKSEKAS